MDGEGAGVRESTIRSNYSRIGHDQTETGRTDFQGLRRSLANLRFDLTVRDTGRKQSFDSSQLRPQWLKGWFRQHTTEYIFRREGSFTNSQFDMWFADLDCWYTTQEAHAGPV